MSESVGENELSPLDQIRQVESEIAGRIAAARERAEQVLERARTQTAQLRRQAREAGIAEGQIRYKNILIEAEEEARVIIAHAQNQAEEMRNIVSQNLDRAVRQGVDLVRGMEG